MKPICETGSLRQFDKLVSNYLKDGYAVTVFFKDDVGLFLKLRHLNGNIIIAKYDIRSCSYTFN